MPFHSVARLKIEVQSDCGKLSFRPAKTHIVSYSADEGADGRKPKVVSVQRYGTGEELDAKAWHFKEIKGDLAKCMPDIRLFELVFEGKEFTERLNMCSEGLEPTVNLYRSITSGDRVRFTVAVGETTLCPLDVQLSYVLEQGKKPSAASVKSS